MKKFKAVLIKVDVESVDELNKMFNKGYMYEDCITQHVAASASTCEDCTRQITTEGKAIVILSSESHQKLE